MSDIQRIGVTHRWSDVVIHNGTAYFVEVPDNVYTDARSQIEQVLKQIEQRLSSINSDKTRLLQVIIYLPHPEDLAVLNELWDAWVPSGHPPSRACIHATLAMPELRVEMILTAAV
jgi:enamine deaminase RidA (YjgF/YER057c/UK114 family)